MAGCWEEDYRCGRAVHYETRAPLHSLTNRMVTSRQGQGTKSRECS